MSECSESDDSSPLLPDVTSELSADDPSICFLRCFGMAFRLPLDGTGVVLAVSVPAALVAGECDTLGTAAMTGVGVPLTWSGLLVDMLV